MKRNEFLSRENSNLPNHKSPLISQQNKQGIQNYTKEGRTGKKETRKTKMCAIIPPLHGLFILFFVWGYGVNNLRIVWC